MREYDFSSLVRPLHACTRTYVANRNGTYEVLVVQSEGVSPPDAIVYASNNVYDAREAAAEVGSMIVAAQMLAGRT